MRLTVTQRSEYQNRCDNTPVPKAPQTRSSNSQLASAGGRLLQLDRKVRIAGERSTSLAQAKQNLILNLAVQSRQRACGHRWDDTSRIVLALYRMRGSTEE